MRTWSEYRQAYSEFLRQYLEGYQAIYWHSRAMGFGHDSAHETAQVQSASEAAVDFLISTGGDNA